MTTNIRFAVPTHQRYEILKSHTLAYLNLCGIPNINIDIFVSNGNEYAKYMDTGLYTQDYGFCICSTDNVRDKFNAIHSHYLPGTNVVVIEDDIESIKYSYEYNQLTERTNILEDCIKAFDLCVKHNTNLWGISSNSNPFFLKNQAKPCFKLCVANFYGFIAERPPMLVTQHTKTDYERTILYTLKYGHVIRLDYLCPITKNYKNQGGMQSLAENERYILEQQACEYLAKTYPELCRRNDKKNSRYPEVYLVNKKVTSTQNNLFNL